MEKELPGMATTWTSNVSISPASASDTHTPFFSLQRAARRTIWLEHRYWILVLLGLALLGGLVPFERIPIMTCGMQRTTGLPCPLCGSTRTFRLLLRGEWRQATVYSPLLVVFYLACTAYVAAVATALLTGRRFVLCWTRQRGWLVAATALVLVLANWLYRLYMTITGAFPPLPWDIRTGL